MKVYIECPGHTTKMMPINDNIFENLQSQKSDELETLHGSLEARGLQSLYK